MSDIKQTLFVAFNLSNEKLDQYSNYLGRVSNVAKMVEAIEILGRKYSRDAYNGKPNALPTAGSIESFYKKICKDSQEIESPKKIACGVYDYNIRGLVPNNAHVVPVADMVKVGIINSQDCLKFLYSEDSAYKYIWACYDMANGSKPKLTSRPNNLSIPNDIYEN